MILSIKPACQVPFKRNLSTTQKNNKLQNNIAVKYAYSFVKHSAESVPALFAMTALCSHLDKASNKMTFSQAFLKNFKGFFLPVLVASSAVLSYIDNRDSKRINKEV